MFDRLDARVLPSGVPASWSSRGAGGGGALFSPQINPGNPAEEFIASDMSELFHTTDGGASWHQVDFRQIQASHETAVEYTETPGLVYSLDYSGNGTVPTRSTDGGLTWQPLANDPTGGGAFKLFADPANHNHLLVSDYTHLYSSLDGGTTWGLRYTTSDSGAGLHLAGAFFDGPHIYVGSNAGLLVSADGGATFALSTAGGFAAGQVMLGFAGSKQGATTRLIAITRAAADVYAGIQGYDYQYPESVYTLDVGQPSWLPKMTGIDPSAYPNYVGMSSGDVNDAYLAGGSTGGTPTVYKTTDGGNHWTSVFLTANNQNIATGWSGQGGDRQWSYGEVALGLAVAPNDPNHLVFTDLGFAHESTDGGASWHALYVAPADLNPANAPTPRGRNYHDSGLDNTTSWGINWVDATHMIVGNSDVIAQLSGDGGQSFNFGFTGNNYNSTYRTVTQPATGVVYAATSTVHDMYQSTHLTDASIDGGGGAVLFSTDKGKTWQTLHNFSHPVVCVATDPTNQNRLYASVVNSGTGGIYVTNDAQDGAASVWTRVTNPPRTQGHPFNIQVLNDGSVVATFSGRRAGSPTNFTASSGVFVSTDGGTTWADRSDPAMKYWTTDVVVDPGDSTQKTWYVGIYSGWGGAANNLGGLYKTTDRGQHWVEVQAFNGASSVTFNPADPNEMFVTTEDQGLWFSSNAQASVPTLTQVQSYTFRQPERVFYNPFNPGEIWVTSFGSGLFVGTTAAPTPGVLQFGSATDSVREDGGTATVTVTRTGGSTGAVSVQYATSDGSAKAGTDYTTRTGTLNFADGQTSASFTVPVLNDPNPDGSETVNLTLSSPGGGASLGAQSTAVLTIADTPGVLQFSTPTYSVRDDGGTATITVRRAGGNGGAVSVQYATSDGTARAGTDYTARNGTLNFADGQTSATFTVPILGDPNPDGSETVNLTLTSPTGGASLGAPSTAVLSVTDIPGALQFNAPTFSVREDGATATVTVTRTLGNAGPVTVHYATSDGTAKAGTDYTATQNDLSFAAGQTSASFTVALLNDPKSDGSETINLTLSAPGGGATLGSQSTAVLTLTEVPRAFADFEPDGRTDPGVFRLATSEWLIDRSTGGLLTPIPTFGAPNLSDIPVVGDFDGIGRAEVAVFRPSTTEWFVLGPGGGHSLGKFGAPNLFDIPVPGDYDGVGHAELAVFRPSTSEWFALGPHGGHLVARFGAPNLYDIPVPGDYDGLGRTQPAVFRPSTREWFALGPGGGHLVGTFGAANLYDIPVPGDYDGVGHTQLAVFRPSTGGWFVLGAGGGRQLTTWGATGLTEVPIEGPIGALKKLHRAGPKGPVVKISLAAVPRAGSATVPGPATTAATPAAGVLVAAPGKKPGNRTVAAGDPLGAWFAALEALGSGLDRR